MLKEMNVGAIVANDFARIFYRNANNLGILVQQIEAACGKDQSKKIF